MSGRTISLGKRVLSAIGLIGIGLTLALGSTACAPQQSKPVAAESPVKAQTPIATQSSIGLVSGPDVDPAELAACTAKGGALRHICMRGKVTCVITYPDANKACTDGSQCQSKRCVVEYSATDNPKLAMRGVCKATDDPCGCFTYMQNGKPGPALCVD